MNGSDAQGSGETLGQTSEVFKTSEVSRHEHFIYHYPMHDYPMNYLLTRQLATTYTMRMLSPAEIAQQEADYTALLQKWQPASATKVKEFLATRELVEPEPELRPDVVARLKQKMAAARQTP